MNIIFLGVVSSIAGAEMVNKTLANKMRLVVMEDHTGSAVFIRVLLPQGENDDPMGRSGVADLTAGLVQKGAGSRDAVQMAELVDWMGAELVGYSEAEYTVIGCNVLSTYLDTGLEIVRDMVLSPRMDPREFSLLKDQELAGIKAQRSNPSYLASIQMPPAIFGASAPQGKVKTEKSLKNISLDDVRAFHRKSLQASNAIMLLIGDVDAGKVALRMESFFGDLPSGVPVQLLTDIPKNLASGRVLESVKEDLTQTTVLIGKPCPGRLSPDYYSTLVSNYVLGAGGFVSRLMAALRSKEGKTYGVRSSISSTATPDLFTIKFTTRNEEVGRSLELTLDVMRRFVEEGPTDTEVADAKEFYKGYFFLQTETPSQRASKMLAYLFYGLGLEEFDRYPARIDAVTRQLAHEAAKRHLTAEGLTFSLCGPSSVLQSAKAVLEPK